MNKKGKTRIILGFVLILLLITLTYLLFQIYVLLPHTISRENFATKNQLNSPSTKEFNEPEARKIERPKPLILPEQTLPDRKEYLLERETFSLMNKARAKHGLKLLEWDERIANTAFKHSKDMALNEYINHTNLKGLSAPDRLAQDKIFFLCASENLFFIESRDPKSDLAENAVDGWLNSEGHRRNLLNPNITRAGVGIYCEGKRCYVTANHICSRTSFVQQLENRYIYFFPIYPEDSIFNFPIQINFRIASTQPLTIYLVPGQEQYDKYINRKSFLYAKRYDNVEEVEDIAVIEKGYGFLVVPKRKTGFQIDLEYL